MSLAMTKAERESFLADRHVAIISVAQPDAAPLTVPIWYEYEPGGAVRLVTGARSKKLDLIRSAGRMSLCVQSELPPYRYVTVEGPARIVGNANDGDIRSLAYRYLGEQLGEWYLSTTAEERAMIGNVLIEIRPERWLTADYGKMRAD